MRLPIDCHTARTADTFTAIMLECNRLLFLLNKLQIEDIKHFEKRHMCIGLYRVGDKFPFVFSRPLAPDMESEIKITHLIYNFLFLIQCSRTSILLCSSPVRI